MSSAGHGAGKLILAGEHAVVHGHPAIAFAVSLGTTVRLERIEGPTEVVSHVSDEVLTRAVRHAVGAWGSRVHLHTSLPIGRGMGSSAALSVALVRAAAARDGRALDEAETIEAAMPLERIFHADPSGLDVVVSVRGGLLRFTRGRPPELTPLPLPGWQVVVLDSEAVGVTSELVAGVGRRRPKIDPALDRIGALVDDAAEVLHDTAALGELLDENHALLGEIGVSTPRLDELVQLARRAGARGAKLSGAGGGGVVLALVDDPEPVLRAAKAHRVPAWPCRPASCGESS